jgi:hypothetical protein
VIVAIEDGERTIPADRLLRLIVPGGTAEDVGAPWVELRDGSVLPVVSFSVGGATASLVPRGSMESISLPIGEILAVRLQSRTPEIDAQWQELRDAAPAADLLVVRRDDAIDYLDGVLGEIDEEHVRFTLDGEEVLVARKKVDGLLYYRGTADKPPAPAALLVAGGGMRLAVQRLDLSGNRLDVTTASGLRIALDRQSLVSIDYSSGKLLYLGDLDPRVRKVVPLVALPSDTEIVAGADGPFIDHGFFSRQLIIRTPRKERGRTTWEKVSYDRGVAIRSRTELVYRLPRGFRRFQTIAGIDADLGKLGDVRLVISGDERILYDEPIRGEIGPAEIDLDVADVRRLSVLVDYGDNGDAGDRLYLCNARLTK